MDAIAAIALAANIAQFVEYGFTLAGKAKKLRDFGNLEPELARDAERLKNLATEISSQSSTPSTKDFRDLSDECTQVADSLIWELEKLKPSDAKSKRQRLKALLKSEVKKGDILNFEKRLESCRTQLTLQLANISRIEVNQKLAEIGQDGHRIKTELISISSVTNDLSKSAHVGQEILASLKSLLKSYDNTLDQWRQRAILELLRFPYMHERHDTIADAHGSTFRWLFDEPLDSYDGDDNIGFSYPETFERTYRTKAKEEFIAWLQRGSGFFHIAGKPGAGKSTLMKYICSHRRLDDYLKVWCQGARLCRGQFFFWKPGTTEQKSLKGLLRGLLHSILDKNPVLIQTAFPELWNILLAHPSSSRALEYRDFKQGFDNLLVHANQSSLYKVALIIDGLDEFDGRHLELIYSMKSWTERYPLILKICVSSREYSVFQQAFLDYPKFRLHKVTFLDIARMVSARLESYAQHYDLFTLDARHSLVKLITSRAEGVFLWVSLVLANIEDAIINGTVLGELEDKVVDYPTELESLYWHLIDSIQETDRRWSFRALKMVQFFQSQFAKHFHGSHSFHFSLLQLSFLDDPQCNNFTVNHLMPITRETVASRLENTYRRVYGRCKGLLDISTLRYEPGGPVIQQHITFTHRSIIEFLETPKFVEVASKYLSNFDCFDSFCLTFVPYCLYLEPEHVSKRIYDTSDNELMVRSHIFHVDTFWRPYSDMYILNETVRGYFITAIELQCADSRRFMDFLAGLEEAFPGVPTRLGRLRSFPLQASHYIALTGLECGAYEYLQQLQKSYIKSESFPIHEDVLMECCRHLISALKRYKFLFANQDRCMEVANCFLWLGFDLNQPLPHHKSRGNPITFSQKIISMAMRNRFPEGWSMSTLMDWCLRHGANPDMTIGKLASNGPHSLPWINSRNRWQIFWLWSDEELSFVKAMSVSRFTQKAEVLIVNEALPLCRIIGDNGGVLRLRSLLSIWFPENDYFLKLIDALQTYEAEGAGASAALALPEQPTLPSNMISLATSDYKYMTESDLNCIIDELGLTYSELDMLLGITTEEGESMIEEGDSMSEEGESMSEEGKSMSEEGESMSEEGESTNEEEAPWRGQRVRYLREYN